MATSKSPSKSTGAKKRNQKQAAESEKPQLSLKEQLAQKRKAEKERKAIIQSVSSTFGISAVFGILAALALDPIMGVAVTFALMCLILSFKYPRYAIYAFVFYVPFGGTVTYALGGNALLQLARDAFFIPAVTSVIQFCRKTKQPILLPQGLKMPMTGLMTVAAITMLAVNLPQQLAAGGREQPIMLGVLGLKTLVGYLLLITCIFYLIRTREDVYFILRVQVLLIITCCALGFVQYFMLKTGICKGTVGTGDELFKASLEARCFVGGSLLYTPSQGQVRLPGTFVAPWQWAWFLISSAFFCFGTAFSDRSLIWRILGIISIVMVMASAVISGQRIALALVPTVLVILLVLTGQIANFKRFIPVGVGLALILTFLMARNPAVVAERISSFQSRWQASPPQAFIMQQFQEVFSDQESVLGNGLGRATNAARMFGKIRLIETYHPKVTYEIGIPGLICVLWLYTSLTIETFKSFRATKDPNLRGYCASMWVFVLFISYFPYYYPLDVDPVNVYYWLAAGIALKIPHIDAQERLDQNLQDSNHKLTKKELKQLSKKQVDFT